VIIESLTSPAAAASGPPTSGVLGAFPCSYASIVFTINGQGPYAVKINQNDTTCANDNTTSGDATFSVDCGGNGTFSNSCSGTAICRNGTAVPAYNGACPFTVTADAGGKTKVTAGAGVTMLFVAVHDGSCSGHFCTTCTPGSAFDVASGNCTPS